MLMKRSTMLSGRRRRRLRATAAFLAGLLLAAGADAIKIEWKTDRSKRQSTATRLATGVGAIIAVRLAAGVGAVKGRFAAGRKGLPVVKGPGGVPIHPRPAVTALIDATEGDLDHAIAQVGEPGLVALRRWGVEEFRKIHAGLDAPSGGGARTAALSGPQPVAVVASLMPYLPAGGRGGSDPGAQAKAEAARSEGALDRVAQVVERLFTLAKNDDLVVTLWAASTPAQHAIFRFWSQAYVEGSRQGPAIIRTNGQRKGVLRGLYSYSVELSGHPAIGYPAPGGARHAALGGTAVPSSEGLDLVNGSSFFCCRFEDGYCQHVDDPGACQAVPR